MIGKAHSAIGKSTEDIAPMAAIAFFLLHFLLKCIVLALASITMYFAFHLLSLVLERIFAVRDFFIFLRASRNPHGRSA